MKNISAILISIFLFQTAHAFTLNSSTNPNLQGWDDADIKLYVNTANCPAGVDVIGVIKDAVDVWNNVPTSKVKVSYGGETSGTTMSSPTTVYCETNFQAVTHADQNYVPGAAAADGSTGRITRGILYLNASAGTGNIGNFDRTILELILAHEIGHILGLGHSHDKNALMYYDASAKQELSLAQDDIDGISYLYPSDESKGQIMGCGLVKGLPPPSGGLMMMLLASFALPVAVWLRLRALATKIPAHRLA